MAPSLDTGLTVRDSAEGPGTSVEEAKALAIL
jgi:hypothetical protein